MAVLNFFLMGLTVQKAAACEDEDLPHETESQLFSENASSAGLGHSRYYCSLFSVCCRTFTASVPSMGIKLNAIFKKK